MFSVDFTLDPTVYIYARMANHIKDRIEKGELKPDMPLPAERRLADMYGVSLGTARRATEELRSWGMVHTVPSKGTFVARRPNFSEQQMIDTCSERMSWL